MMAIAGCQQPGPITGRAAPITLLPDDGDRPPQQTVASYPAGDGRLQGGNIVRIDTFPTDVPDTAWAGINVIVHGKNVGWVIDGDATRGYRMIYDENANGDLRDDPPHPLTPIADGFELTIEMTLATKDGTPYRWPCRYRVRGDTVWVQSEAARRGTIEIGGVARAFELRGNGGFSHDHALVALDLDGDGVAGPQPVAGETARQQLVRELDSPEVIKVGDRTVNVGDRTYDVAVDAHGDELRLTPRAQRLPDRPSVAAGATPPDFTLDDLDGHPVQLSALRGHPVLIDFWTTHCGPCIASMPRIAALAQAHPELEVVALAGDESVDDVRATLAQHPHAGLAALYNDRLSAQYRIEWWPSYFLVGADGKIAIARGSLDAIAAYLDGHRG